MPEFRQLLSSLPLPLNTTASQLRGHYLQSPQLVTACPLCVYDYLRQIQQDSLTWSCSVTSIITLETNCTEIELYVRVPHTSRSTYFLTLTISIAFICVKNSWNVRKPCYIMTLYTSSNSLTVSTGFFFLYHNNNYAMCTSSIRVLFFQAKFWIGLHHLMFARVRPMKQAWHVWSGGLY